MSAATAPSFTALVQEFFTHYLVEQRAVSPQTVAAYRDAFVLLFDYAKQNIGKAPTDLKLEDLEPTLITSFLNDLETVRGNTVRTRNARLAAIRSFLQFASRRDVTCLHTAARSLAIPMKRFDRPMLGFLSREQVLAVLALPGDSWFAERDRLLLHLLYNTGARISEMIAVKVEDVVISESASVHLFGKGRKHRTVPLWPTTAKLIRHWLKSNMGFSASTPLLPNRRGTIMTRVNAAQRLELAIKHASIKHQTSGAFEDANFIAHASTHNCNASVAIRCRYQCYRIVAWP